MRDTGPRTGVACIVALGGCVQGGSIQPSPLVVNVKSEGDECRVAVARASDTLPPNFVRVDQPQLLQMARVAASRRAVVVFDINAHYKCIGAAIITMQEAGMTVEVQLGMAGDGSNGWKTDITSQTDVPPASFPAVNGVIVALRRQYC